MAVPQQALSSATSTFQSSFVSIQNDFLGYGQAIFFALLGISITLKALEYAGHRDIGETLPKWMRELLGAMFFYTLMLNLAWLGSLPSSANTIGLGYLGSVDPSSIVLQGINIANKIMQPLVTAGFMDAGAAMFVGLVCSVVVMFCLINIAINVAVTIVVTQGLISLSPLFLAAGAFKPSSQIARNIIDSIIGNSVKLLGYYIVIFIGNKAISQMVAQIDGTFDSASFSVDQYGYIIAVTALYYSVAKTFPDQLARIVTGTLIENRGTEVAAAAMAMTQMAKQLAPIAKAASSVVSPVTSAAVKTLGSTMANAVANYRQIASSGVTNPLAAAGKATGSAFGNLASSTGGAVADKYRDLASRVSGGAGNSNVKSVSERMSQSTQSIKAQTQAKK